MSDDTPPERDDTHDGGSPATDPAVYDHVRPTTADVTDPGVYRVVGVGGETVTLLRVGDADGYRRNTGQVVTVDRGALDGFEPAENPDGNRSLGEKLRRAGTTLVWNLRAFVAGLRAHPFAAAGALALVVVGHQGDRVLTVPDSWLTAVYFLGVLGVVYLGSRGG